MSDPSRRRGRFAALLALLAIAAVFLLLRSSRRAGSRAPSEPTEDTFRPASGAPPAMARGGDPMSPRPPGAPAPSGSIVPVDPRAEAFGVPQAAKHGWGEYPPGSQPLTEGTSPAMQPPEDDPVDAQKGVHCIFGPRIAVVHPPDPVIVDLEVQNRLGASMAIANAVARFRPESGTNEKGPWFPVDFVDDGSGKDVVAGDRKYTATFKPNSTQQAQLLSGGTHVLIEVAFEAPDGLGPRKYATTARYSREPNATLTGKYTDGVEHGSLVVHASVTAAQAGEYRLIASLYGGEQAIAAASQTQHLDQGDGTIDLLFFGKILHDRGIDGPYELRYVMLSERDGGDVIPGETIDDAYTTQAYRARDFSPDSWTPPPQPKLVKDDKPALFSQADRENLKGPVAPIKPDPATTTPRPVPTGTK